MVMPFVVSLFNLSENNILIGFLEGSPFKPPRARDFRAHGGQAIESWKWRAAVDGGQVPQQNGKQKVSRLFARELNRRVQEITCYAGGDWKGEESCAQE